MVSEDVIVKTSKHGSSVRTTVSITSRQDVLSTGGTSSNDPTTADNGGSLRNKDRKVSKTVKSTVVEEKKEIKKKSSMMEFHNIKISQVSSCSTTSFIFRNPLLILHLTTCHAVVVTFLWFFLRKIQQSPRVLTSCITFRLIYLARKRSFNCLIFIWVSLL